MENGSVTLKYLHTFSIDVCALCVIQIYTEDELLRFWKRSVQEDSSVLLLGGGSNVIFLENYYGSILLNRIKGITISEDENYWYLHACSGELWHELVVYSLDRDIPGLENLAFIPGYVGAAPIRNIGAYGVELEKFCEYVEVLNLDIQEKVRFTVDECQFNYRNSIFLHGINFNYAIVAVGLKLNKHWNPVLNYDGLDEFSIRSVKPFQILHKIFILRKEKLPDPLVSGNAGSFFKNPIIYNRTLINFLLSNYPDMPMYVHENNLVKLSAKWLITHCSLELSRFGKARVYEKNFLILMNFNQEATSDEIIKLALYIHTKVAKKFHVFLEPEVQFIASFGKVDGTKLLSISESALYCDMYNC